MVERKVVVGRGVVIKKGWSLKRGGDWDGVVIGRGW